MEKIWNRIDPLATELGVKADARRKWRERGKIPGDWHLLLLKMAVKYGVPLTYNELLRKYPR